MSAIAAPNERERLETLHRYDILDTPPAPEFDDLARLAADVCATPMALVSFVAADRQWFKARIGLAVEGTARDVSFCAHAIQQPDVFVVPDTLRDDRFAGNPLVVGPPHARFYAGAPLTTPDGYALGTICVIDAVPRELSIAQEASLRALARQVVAQLELSRMHASAAASGACGTRAEELLRAITEGTAAVTGTAFFASLVRHLARALRVRRVYVAECLENNRARSRALWMDHEPRANFEYDVANTPCMKVTGGETCLYTHDVQQYFPTNPFLKQFGAQSYLGVPLWSASGRVIGHMVLVDDKPMTDDPLWVSVMQTFAARAGVELEREQASERLRAALDEVERLKNRLHAENVYLQEEIRQEHNFEEIVGNSPAIVALLQKVERVAGTDATVLVYGETGSGKELIARALHNSGRRRQRPLVKVNCGAVPAALLESELFGHVKGAFTGAIDRRVGRFELADGGTLFLDEIGELPLDTQVKLLRVLQEQEFEPVGSSRTTTVDVRIIAATNRDLAAEVKAGRFRADLFFRLNVVPLTVPPLRERPSDIPLLVAYFLTRFAKKFGRRLDGVSRATMERLTQYPWPGNVRELQNIVERAVVLSRGPLLELDAEVLPTANSRPAGTAAGAGARTGDIPPADASLLPLHEAERRHIESVLQQTHGVVEGPTGAAAILGLHPNTLRSRMKKLRISRTRHGIS